MFTHTDLNPYTGPRLEGFQFPRDVAVFAIGDVHGCRRHLEEILNGMAAIPTPGRRRVLVFLGDLIDRGFDTLGTLQLASRARVDYGFHKAYHLPGNHELMMVDALEAMAEGGDNLLNRPEVANWIINGGAAALAEVVPEWETDLAASAAAFTAALPTWEGMSWIEMLATCPTYLRFGDALLVHAGVAPKVPLMEALSMDRRDHLLHEDKHWAWIRRKFLEWPFGWTENGNPRKNDGVPGCLVVHGHTSPADVARNWVDTPERLLRGLSRVGSLARLNLDGGSAQGLLVAGALLTSDGWRLAAADGLD